MKELIKTKKIKLNHVEVAGKCLEATERLQKATNITNMNCFTK